MKCRVIIVWQCELRPRWPCVFSGNDFVNLLKRGPFVFVLFCVLKLLVIYNDSQMLCGGKNGVLWLLWGSCGSELNQSEISALVNLFDGDLVG